MEACCELSGVDNFQGGEVWAVYAEADCKGLAVEPIIRGEFKIVWVNWSYGELPRNKIGNERLGGISREGDMCDLLLFLRKNDCEFIT
jgi:hypothetical protein